MKKITKAILTLVLVVVLAFGALIGYLTLTEYYPKEDTPAQTSFKENAAALPADTALTFLTWNIGYGGLDEDEDFFMDGGKSVHPVDQAHVLNNVEAIKAYLKEQAADITYIQEIDVASTRTKKLNELETVREALNTQYTYAANLRCDFIPYPLPPIGKAESGVATFSNNLMDEDAIRTALPCPFTWPVRIANLKRCLLLTRFPLEGSDKELVSVNFHLEAYDDGEGKAAQTKALLSVIESEYEKGNYVVAGGDFNQTFPGSLEKYPLKDTSDWLPPQLTEDMLPEGWRFVYDDSKPTCRLLNQPLDETSSETQYYVIDGFITSPNIDVIDVETGDLHFKNSDHNPVRMSIKLN